MRELLKSSQQTKIAGYFPALTGLRAVAAYMVYLHHFNPFKIFENKENELGYVCYAVCKEFHIGVTIFFCLSGFLIAYRYLNRIEFSKQWFFHYFRNRFARIYPMYFLLTLSVFAICLFDPHSIYIGPYNAFKTQREAILIFLLNISFLRGFSDIIKFSGIAPGWSLTVEETFYLFAPVILWLVVDNKRRLWWLLFAFISLGIIFVKAFEHVQLLGVMSSYKFMWSYTFFGRCFEFLGGIFLALFFRSIPASARHRTIVTWAGTCLISVCIALLVLLQGDYERVLINNFILALAILLFFYGLLTEQGIIQRLLASNVLQLLGKSSYVFYLIHVSFISVWLDIMIPSVYLGKFISLNLISVLLYRFIEEPVNGFLRKNVNYR